MLMAGLNHRWYCNYVPGEKPNLTCKEQHDADPCKKHPVYFTVIVTGQVLVIQRWV